MKKDNAATIACIGVLAFIAACVTHEVIGHGGASLVTGGHVTLISPVYFRATNAGPNTDAAGPITNLILGALLFVSLRRREVTSPQWRLFLVTTMALNFFWGAGLFIYTGISKTDDWAFLLKKSEPGMVWLIRGVLILIGLSAIGFRLAWSEKHFCHLREPKAQRGPYVRSFGCQLFCIYRPVAFVACRLYPIVEKSGQRFMTPFWKVLSLSLDCCS